MRSVPQSATQGTVVRFFSIYRYVYPAVKSNRQRICEGILPHSHYFSGTRDVLALQEGYRVQKVGFFKIIFLICKKNNCIKLPPHVVRLD